MLKLLACLALLAGLLVLAVAITMPDGTGTPSALRAATDAVRWTPDLRSLAAGMVIGLVVAWVRAFPWSYLPMILMDYMRVWRRRLTLLICGALFACVLLYY